MNNNDIFICPCCGGRYLDSDYVSPSGPNPVRDIDWENINNTQIGYCDDREMVSFIRDHFETIEEGDYISFFIDEVKYRLYI